MALERLARARDNAWKRLLRFGVIRRWYARRLLKFIEKSRKKKRKLPQHLVQVDTTLRRVPKPQRQSLIEEMLVPGREEQLGRTMRRAASRQDRSSGRGGTGRRPGMPPQQVLRRQVRGPR
jgi:hypothetical protein